MKLLPTLLLASAGLAGLGVLGCDHDHDRMRASPEPAYVVQESPQPQYVVVREAPPAIIVEQRPPPPAVGYLWIDGYWHWGGRQYVWQGGRWSRPPHENYVWIAPRYERHEQGGYRYTPGQWREGPQERRREEEHRDRR